MFLIGFLPRIHFFHQHSRPADALNNSFTTGNYLRKGRLRVQTLLFPISSLHPQPGALRQDTAPADLTMLKVMLSPARAFASGTMPVKPTAAAIPTASKVFFHFKKQNTRKNSQGICSVRKKLKQIEDEEDEEVKEDKEFIGTFLLKEKNEN